MLTNSERGPEKREDDKRAGKAGKGGGSGEGAWYCVCMIGCDGSEAFTHIYECLF